MGKRTIDHKSVKSIRIIELYLQGLRSHEVAAVIKEQLGEELTQREYQSITSNYRAKELRKNEGKPKFENSILGRRYRNS